MITSWEIYLVFQLDHINSAAVMVATGSGMAAVCVLIAWLVFASDDPGQWSNGGYKAAAIRHNEQAPALRKIFFQLLVFLFLPSFALATLLPSTRTAAAMIVAPKIINSPTAQHEAGDLYKLAKQALENAVAPKPGRQP